MPVRSTAKQTGKPSSRQASTATVPAGVAPGPGVMGRPGIRWHLRSLMAARGMYATSDLVAPLAERGVVLSREQVYRLVTGTPERLNTRALAALCDILQVGVGDLIEIVREEAVALTGTTQATAGRTPDATGRARTGTGETAGAQGLAGLRPVRARIADGPAAGPAPGPGGGPGDGAGGA